MHGLELIHAFLTAAIDHALAVADDDVVMRDAELFDQADAG